MKTIVLEDFKYENEHFFCNSSGEDGGRADKRARSSSFKHFIFGIKGDARGKDIHNRISKLSFNGTSFNWHQSNPSKRGKL